MDATKIGPDFLVIGAVKAGTTSLHAYLSQHPDVYLTPIKETNFFSRNDMKFEHFRKDYQYDTELNYTSYLARSPLPKKHIAHVPDTATYQALFREIQANNLTGEVCNSYLICPSSAQTIKAHNPQTKIIAVLRNPAERAFSQYLMNIKEGKTTESDFLTELEADALQTHQGWGVSHQYRELGHYYKQIKRYYDVFPADQIKLLFFEDFKADPQKFLNDLFDFLGLPLADIDTETRLNEAGKPRLGKLNFLLTQLGIIAFLKKLFPGNIRQQLAKVMYTQKGLPSLQNNEREQLMDYYKEGIEGLEKLLGRTLNIWK